MTATLPFVGAFIALIALGCGGARAEVGASAVPTVASAVPPAVIARKGVAHDVATRLAAAIEAGDAAAAAGTFAENGTLARLGGNDARGPAAIAPIFRQAFGLCRMHVVAILEREATLVMQLQSTCTHPDDHGMNASQAHLLAIDVADDSIVRATVFTEIFGLRPGAIGPVRRELEDASTLTPERERRATCIIDVERKLLPKDFANHDRDVWATQSCTVLTVRDTNPTRARPAHAYVEVECTPRGDDCRRSSDSRRYFDWNGYRLMPFADEPYRAKPR